MNAETIVSAQTCDAFPIACVIAFLGLCALFMGWRLIVFAWIGQRFCVMSGGAVSAHRILSTYEEIQKPGVQS